ncbi:MAG: hypothetical protein IJ085_02970 [Turicibacter sp.]|nr:hypothetical protein [Turicibacter sp.]
MNGLEAIELMKQGKIVKLFGIDVKFKIENNRVVHINPDVCDWNFIVNGKYEEVEEPKTLTGWERVEGGKVFKTVSSTTIISSREIGGDVDVELFESANYFSMLEKAKEIQFKQTLFRKLQRFSDENGGNEIDWKDSGQRKFYIYRGHDCEELFIHSASYGQDFGQVYFVSREVAEEAIELFCDDLIKYFTHDWSKGGHE